VIDRSELSGPAKPLAKERWAGGIDSVGSTTLANILARRNTAEPLPRAASRRHGPAIFGGPFILRAGAFLGIDSVMCPDELRKVAWNRSQAILDPGKLSEITH